MLTTSLLVLDTAVVKVQISLGTVGGTVSTTDSETGNALMLVVTNPFGPKIEITACVGERAKGWLGRGRERFLIPMHGTPHRFEHEGEECLVWTEISSLPSLEGLVQMYVRDSNGHEWPLQNPEMLFEIRDRLKRQRSAGRAKHRSGELARSFR